MSKISSKENEGRNGKKNVGRNRVHYQNQRKGLHQKECSQPLVTDSKYRFALGDFSIYLRTSRTHPSTRLYQLPIPKPKNDPCGFIEMDTQKENPDS